MKIKLVAFTFLAIGAGISCRQDEKLSKKEKLVESLTNEKEAIVDTATGESFYPMKELDLSERDKKAKTRITYTKTEVDLGTVTEGEKVKHTFEFKNTGNAPLIIYSAYGSCGCTVPKFSREPIAPGAKGEINVEFDSEGRTGANTKTVTVNANTVPAATTLTFTVQVKPK
jgi:Protein of unknown function (DUF1573)